MPLRIGVFSHQLKRLNPMTQMARDTADVALGRTTARKAPAGMLAGLICGSRAPVRDNDVATGFRKVIKSQLFGTEAQRRTIDPSQQTKLRVGLAMDDIAEVTIPGEAGLLCGHLYKARSERRTGKTALVLSGSGGPAEALAPDIAQKYADEGVDVLAINYRGFGCSEGEPSEQGLYRDAQTMFEHMTRHMNVPPEKVLLHGYSMGAPIAAHLLNQVRLGGHDVAGLVLDRPMPSTSKGVRAQHRVIGRFAAPLAKRVVGTFSVEQHLQGQPAGTKIVMMTDNERLGQRGERLRQRLAEKGLHICGGRVDADHYNSQRVMERQFGVVKQAFLQDAPLAPTERNLPPAQQPASRCDEAQFVRDFAYLRDYIAVR